MAILADDK
ncbi:Protein of unknown function [Bacillus cytotoxicus]|nr:Protein of unknown function [Bacillus cytotoxicus]